MNPQTFDALAKTLAAEIPRRRTIGLMSATVSALLLPLPETALAGCKKVGKKCDKSKDCCDGAKCRGGKHGKCRCKAGLSHCDGEKTCRDLDTDINHCGSCGNACLPDESCCDGLCADLESDSANCGACGQACAETTTCVASVCTTADGCPVGADACAGNRVICGDSLNCVCSRSTEGETICGDAATAGAICGQCESNADCVAFGPGAFCVETGSIDCCGAAAQNVCRLPCSAT